MSKIYRVTTSRQWEDITPTGGGGGGGVSPATETPLSPTSSGSVGTSVKYAREDHQHPAQSIPTASNSTPYAPTSSGSVGYSSSYSRGDHSHPLQSIPSASSSTPLYPTSSGTVGTSTSYARGDHSHPQQTDIVPLSVSSKGTATATGTWNIYNLTIGKPLFIVGGGYDATTAIVRLIALNGVSVAQQKTTFGMGRQTITNDLGSYNPRRANVCIFIPTSSTVSINIVAITSGYMVEAFQ